MVNITLNKHTPSYLTNAGHCGLVSYDGQPQRCYDCRDIGHLYQECLKRKTRRENTETTTSQTWADIILNGQRPQKQTHFDIRVDKNPPCQSESPHYDNLLHCRDQDHK